MSVTIFIINIYITVIPKNTSQKDANMTSYKDRYYNETFSDVTSLQR